MLMKVIRKFISLNKCITIFFGIALIIIVSYMLSMDYPEWFNGADKLFNLFFQFSIGYIINFMFYVTQIYIPNSKRDQSAKQCINIRINKIIKHMKGSISQLSQIYIPGHNNMIYTDVDLNKLMILKFSDKINAMNANTGESFTVREWIKLSIFLTEKEINSLYQYYPNYISAQLMGVLEKIIDSTYHNTMNTMTAIPQDVDFSKSNNCFFIQYNSFIDELEKIKNQDYS